MSSRIFNIFFGRMVRRVNERATGRGGEWRGWEIKGALVVETRGRLQCIVNEFERECDRMGLKINVREHQALVV